MTSTLGVGRPLDTSDMAALIMLPGLRVQPYSSLPTNTLPLNNTWMCNGWVGGHVKSGSPHLKAPPLRLAPWAAQPPCPCCCCCPGGPLWVGLCMQPPHHPHQPWVGGVSPPKVGAGSPNLGSDSPDSGSTTPYCLQTCHFYMFFWLRGGPTHQTQWETWMGGCPSLSCTSLQ